jgi:hypothetical protein
VDASASSTGPRTPAWDEQQLRSLRVLLFDERECGASTDRVLRHTSVSSQAYICRDRSVTPARRAEQQQLSRPTSG